MQQARSHTSTAGDIDANLKGFQRRLRAENRSPATVEVYTQAVNQLEAFLRERGMPMVVAEITREHVEEFQGDLLTRFKASTANLMSNCQPAPSFATIRLGPISSRPLSTHSSAFPIRPSMPGTPKPPGSSAVTRRMRRAAGGVVPRLPTQCSTAAAVGAPWKWSGNTMC